MSQAPSAACCNTPPIVGTNYSAKGDYTQVEGLKTYQTGPDSAEKGILIIYDIFGFFPQTLQGADILATSDKEQPYKVFMPDFLEGKPADISWYPPDTKEKEQKLGEFFQTTGAPPKSVQRIPGIVAALSKAHPKIKSWGIVGFCWGGKVANFVSGDDSPFKASAIAHPAMVDPNDAPNIKIPILVIPSKDESKDDVDAFAGALKVPHKVELYHDQIHGFMAARSNLEDKNVVAAYEKAYKSVLTWFHEHL